MPPSLSLGFGNGPAFEAGESKTVEHRPFDTRSPSTGRHPRDQIPAPRNADDVIIGSLPEGAGAALAAADSSSVVRDDGTSFGNSAGERTDPNRRLGSHGLLESAALPATHVPKPRYLGEVGADDDAEGDNGGAVGATGSLVVTPAAIGSSARDGGRNGGKAGAAANSNVDDRPDGVAARGSKQSMKSSKGETSPGPLSPASVDILPTRSMSGRRQGDSYVRKVFRKHGTGDEPSPSTKASSQIGQTGGSPWTTTAQPPSSDGASANGSGSGGGGRDSATVSRLASTITIDTVAESRTAAGAGAGTEGSSNSSSRSAGVGGAGSSWVGVSIPRVSSLSGAASVMPRSMANRGGNGKSGAASSAGSETYLGTGSGNGNGGGCGGHTSRSGPISVGRLNWKAGEGKDGAQSTAVAQKSTVAASGAPEDDREGLVAVGDVAGSERPLWRESEDPYAAIGVRRSQVCVFGYMSASGSDSG